MKRLLIFVTLIALCFALPANERNDDKSSKLGLTRPSPINPDIIGDPKPLEKAVNVETTHHRSKRDEKQPSASVKKPEALKPNDVKKPQPAVPVKKPNTPVRKTPQKDVPIVKPNEKSKSRTKRNAGEGGAGGTPVETITSSVSQIYKDKELHKHKHEEKVQKNDSSSESDEDDSSSSSESSEESDKKKKVIPNPAVNIPGINTPATNIPAANIPAVNTPAVNIPGVNIPGVNIPGVNTPAANIPAENIPAGNIPAVNIPAVNIPSVNIPAVNTPAENIPAVNIPGVNIPAANTPAVNIPGVNIPAVNTPAANIPAGNIPEVNTPLVSNLPQSLQTLNVAEKPIETPVAAASEIIPSVVQIEDLSEKTTTLRPIKIPANTSNLYLQHLLQHNPEQVRPIESHTEKSEKLETTTSVENVVAANIETSSVASTIISSDSSEPSYLRKLPVPVAELFARPKQPEN